MGQVQERLVLTDDFTAAFARFLNLGESAVRTAGDVNSSIIAMGRSSNDIAAAGFSMLDQKLSDLTGKIQESNNVLIETIDNQSRLGQETQKTNDQA